MAARKRIKHILQVAAILCHASARAQDPNCLGNNNSTDCQLCLPAYFRGPTADSCSPCECDIGGSLSAACHNTTGQCECRPNLEGRTCTEPATGFYRPMLDELTIEAELQEDAIPQGGTYEVIERAGHGEESATHTGLGFVQLSEGETFDFLVTVPVSALYDVVLRYEASVEWPAVYLKAALADRNLVYVPTFECTGDSLVRGAEQVSLKAAESGGVVMGKMCVEADVLFRLTFSSEPQESRPAAATLLVDSLVFIPSVMNFVSYLNASDQSLVHVCVTAAVTANRTYRAMLAQPCNSLDFSVMVELYNGAVACRCDDHGSTSRSCDPSGGQCPCRSNVMLQDCSVCKLNYYGFHSAAGCKRRLYWCDFEGESLAACGLVQDTSRSDLLIWSLGQGDSSGALTNTGPGGDYSKGGEGHYAFLDASATAPNTDEALLRLNPGNLPVAAGSTDRCLTFLYSMHGRDIGSLSVYAVDAQGTVINQPLWRLVGSAQNEDNVDWHYGYVDLPPAVRVFMFGATRRGPYGDIALDSIGVHDLSCQRKVQCVDPGTPPGARQIAHSYDLGKSVSFECLREGFTVSPADPLTCAPQRSSEVQWDRTLPECVDTTPPVIRGLCDGSLTIDLLTAPISSSSGFSLPTASDNSGATERSMDILSMPKFNPSALLSEGLTVRYIVRDFNYNQADCFIEINIKDGIFPTLTCPESYAIVLDSAASRTISFPQEGHESSVRDNEATAPSVTYSPAQWTVSAASLGEVRRIDVTAVDASNNKRECAYTVHIEAAPCQDWALAAPMGGAKTCTRNDEGDGFFCVLSCDDGFYFYDDPTSPERTYSCNDGEAFTPAGRVPNCVPARFSEFVAAMKIYFTFDGTFSTRVCNEYYKTLIKRHVPKVAAAYAAQCTSAWDMDVDIVGIIDNSKYFNIAYDMDANEAAVTVTYRITVQAPSPENLFNDCSSRIRSGYHSGEAFEVGEMVSTAYFHDCPVLTRKLEAVSHVGALSYAGCEPGYKLIAATFSMHEFCVACPYGHFYDPAFNVSDPSFCQPCENGKYQDEIPSTQCKTCPPNTYRYTAGTGSVGCEDTCVTLRMISQTLRRFAPCMQCPTGSYAIESRTCRPCPAGTNTDGPGASLVEHCLHRCPSGHWSVTGLEECLMCPPGFYQDRVGQDTCKECKSEQVTLTDGAVSIDDCVSGWDILCTADVCNGHGNCTVFKHLPMCICDRGYTGWHCDVEVNYCESSPCYAQGECSPRISGYSCDCPSADFSGKRCEFDPYNCGNVECQNGGQCQDLLDDYKCLCAENYAGEFCQYTDYCKEKPCQNGGQCKVVDSTSRECTCPEGYGGADCEFGIISVSIDGVSGALVEGANLTLTCRVNGAASNVQYSWGFVRSGEQSSNSLPGGATYSKPNVALSDAGVYTCTAATSSSPPASQSVTVLVVEGDGDGDVAEAQTAATSNTGVIVGVVVALLVVAGVVGGAVFYKLRRSKHNKSGTAEDKKPIQTDSGEGSRNVSVI